MIANLEWTVEIPKDDAGKYDYDRAFALASEALALFSRKANGGAYQGDTVRIQELRERLKPRRLRLVFSASKGPLGRLRRLDPRFRLLQGHERIVIR